MKSIKFFLITIILLVSIIPIFSKSRKKPKYNFLIATDAPKGTLWYKALQNIDKELYKKTNGEVGLTIYGGTMGNSTTVFKKIKIGQLSGATFGSKGLGLIYKDLNVLGFPMLFDNYQEFDYMIKKISPFFEKKLEEKGFIHLAWSEVGFIYLYSKKKVNSLDSLRKSKPIKLDDKITKMLYKKLGVTPIAVDSILSGLQTGAIDTIFASPYALIAMQWYNQVKYVADFPFTFVMGALVIDSKLFNSMPKEYRVMMKNVAKKQFNKLTIKVRKNDLQANEALKNNGLATLQVTKQNKQKFKDISNKVSMALTEKEYSRDVLLRIKNFVEEYRKNH